MLWANMLVHCAFLSGIMFALCLCHPVLQSLSEVIFANQGRLRVGPNFLGYRSTGNYYILNSENNFQCNRNVIYPRIMSLPEF